MRKLVCLLIAMFYLIGVGMAQTPKKKVAVYVTGESEIESSYKKVIGSKMVSEITKSSGFSAVERTADFLAALTKEQDYQTSGAVKDNQIVKIGQQFGVRYVAVVDVSELFEALFISTRMIDVQTGEIISSAEDSKAVNGMAELTSISEGVAKKLISTLQNPDFVDGKVKCIGPFSTCRELYNYKSCIPAGYRMATKEDLLALFERNDVQFYFPIYTDLICTDEAVKDDYESGRDKKGHTIWRDYYYQRYELTGIRFNNRSDIESKSKYQYDKITFRFVYNYNRSGRYDENAIGKPGYIYIIRQ